ncbi:mitochondrial ribosomal protein subunit L20-domain-containing protein [Tirmania nivea]|nr:mitochondrial ribosomal protein subunit L20-domain-containing protein [Tirmania nivea]
MATFYCLLSPILRRLTTSPPSTIITPTKQFLRHESSARRLTKRLRLQPDPTFLPLPSASIPTSQSPHASARLAACTPRTSTIIYNPPASMPSVYATPSIFIPASDPRKNLPTTSLTASTESNTNSLPPPLRQPKAKKYHLTQKEISEIRELRQADPLANSRTKLAKKYSASRFFVGMVAEAGEKHKKVMAEEQEKVKESWGRRRTEARIDRKKRRAGWGGADGN